MGLLSKKRREERLEVKEDKETRRTSWAAGSGWRVKLEVGMSPEGFSVLRAMLRRGYFQFPADSTPPLAGRLII